MKNQKRTYFMYKDDCSGIYTGKDEKGYQIDLIDVRDANERIELSCNAGRAAGVCLGIMMMGTAFTIVTGIKSLFD